MLQRFKQPKNWQWGTMTNADQAALRYGSLARHEKPRANIILAPGLNEFAEKYFETIRILSRLGYNIYVLNWRGQGGSDPYLTDASHRHSLGFYRDARDLVQFMEGHVPKDGPNFLLAHSMGGLIGILTMILVPEKIRGTILSAPLLGFQHRLGTGMETALARVPLTRSLLERYIPGGKPWMLRCDYHNPMMQQDYTSDPMRMQLTDLWTIRQENLRVGAPTLGFAKESSRAMIFLRRQGVMESIDVPTMVMTAGDDRIVSNAHIFNAVARMPNATHTHFPNAKHEIMHETRDVRQAAIRNIHNFILNLTS